MTLEIGMHMNGLGGSQAAPEIGQHPVTWGKDARLDETVKKFGSASLRLSLSANSFLKIAARNAPNPKEFFLAPGSPAFSISFWARWTTDQTDMTLISFNNDDTGEFRNNGYEIRWTPTGGGRFEVMRNTGYEGLTTHIAGHIPVLDQFYYIQLKRSLGSNNVNILIDGATGFTVNVLGGWLPPVDGFVDFIVGNNSLGTEPFHGYIDDLLMTRNEAVVTTVPVGEFSPPDLPGANTVIFPSVLIGKGSVPTSSNDLWEPASFILANWVDRLEFAEAFNTRIVDPITDAEKRTQLVDRPYRTMRINLTGMAQNQTQALGNQMMRWGEARTLIPVYMDRSKLTAAAASAQPTFNCDTTNRRFFVGQRVLLAGTQVHCELVDTELGEILSFTDTSITLTANLAASFKQNAIVYPLMEAKVILQSNRVRTTGHLATARLEFLETEGRTAMPPVADLNTVPAGVAEYLEFPIFKWTLQENAEENIRRSGQELSVGRATVTDLFGSRAKVGFTGGVCHLTKAAAHEFTEFFHGRGGQTCPFWAPSSFSEYELLEVNANNIRVTAVGEVGDWSFRPFFALVEFDGIITIRQIATVVRGAGIDTLGFTDGIAVSIGDVKRTARAGLVRFATDELRFIWTTLETAEARIKYLETLEEKSLDAGIEYLPTPDDEVCFVRQDVECDDCENSDPECDPQDDTPPNADGEGTPL